MTSGITWQVLLGDWSVTKPSSRLTGVLKVQIKFFFSPALYPSCVVATTRLRMKQQTQERRIKIKTGGAPGSPAPASTNQRAGLRGAPSSPPPGSPAGAARCWRRAGGAGAPRGGTAACARPPESSGRSRSGAEHTADRTRPTHTAPVRGAEEWRWCGRYNVAVSPEVGILKTWFFQV